MANLSDTDRHNFLAALGVWNNSSLAVANRGSRINGGLEICDIASIVQTHETLADFQATRGKPSASIATPDGVLHEWRRVQFRRGQTSGSLFLMEFDGVSASFFTGG